MTCDSDVVPQSIGPDTVCELTPQGHTLFRQILTACSEYAGRDISSDELSVILKKLRSQTGYDDPPFTDPKVMECFKRLLSENNEN